ncbi:hypothetical protein P5673_032194 [Acropora cervicornis]|uniref:Uncharacterized protein n=1 Tax=Acropora cervicornis TaxID=6130 RepID=A0AAD9PRM1_ACRCE|nr:hypothetical protein P5673_032194 [Acropora cervicornis]
MTRARVLAEDCEYKDKEEQLIDTLIFGVLSIDVRRKLLTKDSALKLNDAMKIARAEEETHKTHLTTSNRLPNTLIFDFHELGIAQIIP